MTTYKRPDGTTIELNDAPANKAFAAKLGWEEVSSGDTEEVKGEEISQPETDQVELKVSKPNTRRRGKR